MMKKNEFLTCVSLYQQRYGSFTMAEETADMWFSKLEGYEYPQVKEAFTQLLGRENGNPFGWKVVIQIIDQIFPPETPQEKLDREWKQNPLSTDSAEKQREISAFLRGVMDEVKVRKRKKQPPLNWLSLYADKHIEIWGANEAGRQIRAIKDETYMVKKGDKFIEVSVGASEDTHKFCRMVSDRLHDMARSGR